MPSFPASSIRRSVSRRCASIARLTCSAEDPGGREKSWVSKGECRKWAGPDGVETNGSNASPVVEAEAATGSSDATEVVMVCGTILADTNRTDHGSAASTADLHRGSVCSG